MKLIMKILVLNIILLMLTGCNPRYGFMESQFHLAPDSRWPKWFDMPAGYSKNNLDVTLTFYSHPFKRPVVITVKNRSQENNELLEVVGRSRWHPSTEEQGYSKYPTYIIITVNNIDEVLEQRTLGNIMHITDDPKIVNTTK